MDLFQFVETEYGVEAAANMKNIHIGGSNNQKGSLFEQHFAICKICEIAINYQDRLSNVIVSAQEVGFVDDFCVRYNHSKIKMNYQAKNSAGAAADWTIETTTRFMRQYLIDISFHKFASSSQILLVSCPEKKLINQQKIPENIHHYASSEFFPYYDNNYELLTKYSPLRQNLEKITGQVSLDQLDYALKLIHGAWMSTVESRSVQQILDSVECEGKPSIFRKSMLELEKVPVWLSDLIRGNPAFNGVRVSVECARVKVRCKGFEATVSLMLFNKTPDQDELNSLTNPLQLINFVIKKAQAELS